MLVLRKIIKQRQKDESKAAQIKKFTKIESGLFYQYLDDNF